MSKSPSPYVVQDTYFKLAKAQWYRARSAFKLIEIDDRLKLFRPGMRVMDLASAPWSWLQVLSQRVGETGLVIGSDIQLIEPLRKKNVFTYVADVFVPERIDEIFLEHGLSVVDSITSDIAPATSGVSSVDQYRSVELNLAILEIAKKRLKTGGSLVLKVFIGEDVNDLVAPMKAAFASFKRMKPKACRDRSFEEYFIGMGKKG